MKLRALGELEVGAIGLGEMPLSVEGRPDVDRSLETVKAALDAGVTLIDTADAYCLGPEDFGHGETLTAELLRRLGATDRIVVATKGGHVRTPGGGWELDGRPEHLRRAAKDSLRRLGTEAIDLYQLHRPDPQVPYAESVGALAELVDRGIVRTAGVSNADEQQIRLAHELLGDALVAVQNELSPRFRSSEPETGVCEELGLAFLAWSPLGGAGAARGLGGEHGAFAQVAAEHGVSPQRVCLAWLLAKSPAVIPIPGARRPETIGDSAMAPSLELSADELALLG